MSDVKDLGTLRVVTFLQMSVKRDSQKTLKGFVDKVGHAQVRHCAKRN